MKNDDESVDGDAIEDNTHAEIIIDDSDLSENDKMLQRMILVNFMVNNEI